MGDWVLIITLLVTNPVPQDVTGFKTEMSCKLAAKQYKDELHRLAPSLRVSTLCVRR